jgi:hypothetical protein
MPLDPRAKIEDSSLPEPMSGCWLWLGKLYRNGYGSAWTHGAEAYAHRASWEAFVGPIPTGLSVLHRCDTPACVNPEHLWLGTHRDNMRDMTMKGRHARIGLTGERHPAAKITEETARQIRQRRGENQRALAREFGVSQATVWAIQSRRHWRHLGVA